MSSSLDIYLDKSGDLIAGGSAPYGTLPVFTRNDEYVVRLRVLERNQFGAYTDSNLVSPSFRLGIGISDTPPNYGNFKLIFNSVTSNAISFNATTTQLYNSISSIAGNVNVLEYGQSGSAWLITAATQNTALSFLSDSYTLFPTSSIIINDRKLPEPGVFAQQIITLIANPYVFSDSFNITTGIGAQLNKTQDGDQYTNTTYELSIGNDVIGGSFAIAFNGYSTSLDYNADASGLNEKLSAITGIGSENILVVSDNKRGFVISFINQLGLQNVVTPLLFDSSGLVNAIYYQSVITLATSQLNDFFVESNSNEITPTLEIELNENGAIKTILQSQITIRKDLITTGFSTPASNARYYTSTECDSIFATSSCLGANYYNKTQVDTLINAITTNPVTGDYYTKAQSDSRYPTTASVSASYYTKIQSTSLFIQNTTGNINSTSRALINNNAITILNYQSGLIGYSGALQVPTSSYSIVTIGTNLNVASVGIFNGISSNTITSENLNVVSTAIISGNLIVYGSVSANIPTVNTTSFILNDPTNIYATGRVLKNSSVTMLDWSNSSQLETRAAFKCYSDVSVLGNTKSQELSVTGTLNVVCGSINLACGGITAYGDIGTTSGNLGGKNLNVACNGSFGGALQAVNSIQTSGNVVAGMNLYGVDCVLGSTLYASTVVANALSFTTISFQTVSATAITCNELKINSKFGMLDSAVTGSSIIPRPRYNILHSTPEQANIQWKKFNVCSDGVPAVLHVLCSTTTPSGVGYDWPLRNLVHDMLDAFGQTWYGLLNVTTY